MPPNITTGFDPIQAKWRDTMQAVFGTVCEVMPDVGMCLFLFDQHDGQPRANYISNTERPQTIAAIKEWISRQEQAEPHLDQKQTQELSAALDKNESVITYEEALRRKVERRVAPSLMGNMLKISKLINWARGIQEKFGDTCVYAVDLSWGAVALNRSADDAKRLLADGVEWLHNPEFAGTPAVDEEKEMLRNAVKAAARFFREAMPQINIKDSCMDTNAIEAWNTAEIAIAKAAHGDVCGASHPDTPKEAT